MLRMLAMVAVVGVVLSVGAAHAAVRTQNVEYRQGDAVLEGYLAYDDAAKMKQPGVLVVHEWYGLNDYVKGRARQLAGLGYVAFAADIYGKGLRAKNAEEARPLASRYLADRPLLRARAQAALDVLRQDSRVDPLRLAAIGYCFGGTTVLELARSGAPLLGTVSFHGGLSTPTPQDARNIKGRVLALTGGDDPNVPPEQVTAFEQEMREGHVNWQLTSYGGAVHSFTNPAAGDDPTKGAAYNAQADRRSWAEMRRFLSEVFGETGQGG